MTFIICIVSDVYCVKCRHYVQLHMNFHSCNVNSSTNKS